MVDLMFQEVLHIDQHGLLYKVVQILVLLLEQVLKHLLEQELLQVKLQV